MSLHDIQTKVHVGKDKRNDFGGYNYRTAEGILAAAKAALPEGATIVVSDQMQEVAGQIFVSATATIALADGTSYSASGHAMHPLTKKGMDPSQITGAASSYARKYALGGLLALDDGSADPDASKKPYEPDFGPVKDALMKATTMDELAHVWSANRDAQKDKEVLAAKEIRKQQLTQQDAA